jgi:hypothetical protein
VFLAGPTFTLLPDDDTASAALRAIRRHLTDDGAAVVPLFLPAPTDPAELGRTREARAVLRYERLAGDDATVLDRTWTLHWHDRTGFEALAAGVGLATEAVVTPSGRPAPDDARAFTFVLRPAG